MLLTSGMPSMQMNSTFHLI